MTKLSRQRADDLIVDYLYGELSADDALAFEAAMGDYPDLATEIEGVRAVREAMARVPDEPVPAPAIDAIMGAARDAASGFRADAARPSLWERLMRLVTQPAFATAMVAVLVTGVAFFMVDGDLTRPDRGDQLIAPTFAPAPERAGQPEPPAATPTPAVAAEPDEEEGEPAAELPAEDVTSEAGEEGADKRLAPAPAEVDALRSADELFKSGPKEIAPAKPKKPRPAARGRKERKATPKAISTTVDRKVDGAKAKDAGPAGVDLLGPSGLKTGGSTGSGFDDRGGLGNRDVDGALGGVSSGSGGAKGKSGAGQAAPPAVVKPAPTGDAKRSAPEPAPPASAPRRTRSVPATTESSRSDSAPAYAPPVDEPTPAPSRPDDGDEDISDTPSQPSEPEPLREHVRETIEKEAERVHDERQRREERSEEEDQAQIAALWAAYDAAMARGDVAGAERALAAVERLQGATRRSADARRVLAARRAGAARRVPAEADKATSTK